MAVGLSDLALIEDINVSWFILFFWHVETTSGELELANCLISGVNLPCDIDPCLSQLDRFQA